MEDHNLTPRPVEAGGDLLDGGGGCSTPAGLLNVIAMTALSSVKFISISALKPRVSMLIAEVAKRLSGKVISVAHQFRAGFRAPRSGLNLSGRSSVCNA